MIDDLSDSEIIDISENCYKLINPYNGTFFGLGLFQDELNATIKDVENLLTFFGVNTQGKKSLPKRVFNYKSKLSELLRVNPMGYSYTDENRRPPDHNRSAVGIDAYEAGNFPVLSAYNANNELVDLYDNLIPLYAYDGATDSKLKIPPAGDDGTSVSDTALMNLLNKIKNKTISWVQTSELATSISQKEARNLFGDAMLEIDSDLDQTAGTTVAQKITNIKSLDDPLDPAKEVTTTEVIQDLARIIKFLGTGETDRTAELTLQDLPKADMEYLSEYDRNAAGTNVKNATWTGISTYSPPPDKTILVRFRQYAGVDIYTLPTLNAYFIYNGGMKRTGEGNFLGEHDLLVFESPVTSELLSTWANDASNPGGGTAT